MKRPSKHLLLILASLVLHGVSSALLWQHASVVSALQGSAVPVIQEIPALERKEKLLKEQVALAETEASLKDSSASEYISAFVLPDELDLDRALGFFDAVRDDFSERKLLTEMSAIEVGDNSQFSILNSQLFQRPITLSLTLIEEGLSEFMNLLQLTGVFTVGDAFRAEDVATLLSYTSREHPTAIVSLEQFLETPLTEYAREPRHYEDRLLRSASSEEFLSMFDRLRDASRLPAIQKLFQSELGKTLLERRLWPTPFLMIDEVTVEAVNEGKVRVAVKLLAYERK